MTFPSRPEYERLVYGLLDDYPKVVGSTLRMYSTSSLTAIVEGRVMLRNGLVLRVTEALDFKMGRIRHYSYTIFRENEKTLKPTLEGSNLTIKHNHTLLPDSTSTNLEEEVWHAQHTGSSI